jgi:hypothetical protein
MELQIDKLSKIINSMALKQFKVDIYGSLKRNAFMLEHAQLGEFVKFFQNKKLNDNSTKSWAVYYSDSRLGNLNGLAETFCMEILWPRMKDTYIENVVKELDNKLDQSYKITIEQV